MISIEQPRHHSVQAKMGRKLDRYAKTKMLLATLAAMVVLAGADAADTNWTTDFPAAQTQAVKENKLILLDFSSSDSCIACVKLRKEVFSQPVFLNYARTNLVLVEVDFPYRKPLNPAQQKANDALAAKYGVDSYPTIVIVDGAGRKVGVMEEIPNEPQAFIAAVEQLKK